MSRGLPLKNILEDFARVAGPGIRTDDTTLPSLCGGHPLRSQIEQRIADAYERGVSDGRATTHVEMELAIAEQRAASEFDGLRQRAEWVTQESDVLVSRLIDGFAKLELAIVEPVQQLLVPILRAELHQQFFRDLVAKVLRLRGDLSSFSVEVHGATDLLEALRTRLEPHGISMITHPQSGTGLTIKHDQTLLEANIADWCHRVGEALA